MESVLKQIIPVDTHCNGRIYDMELFKKAIDELSNDMKLQANNMKLQKRKETIKKILNNK